MLIEIVISLPDEIEVGSGMAGYPPGFTVPENQKSHQQPPQFGKAFHVGCTDGEYRNAFVKDFSFILSLPQEDKH